MRPASYNVENLLQRAKAMDGATLDEGKQALADHAAINATLAKASYSAADKAKIVSLLTNLGHAKDDGGSQSFMILRRNRGHLIKRPKDAPMEVVANGRGDWIGWVELKVEAVEAVATQNTARIVRDVDADVLAVVEAENRPSLVRFVQDVVAQAPVNGPRFDQIMLIDGNDQRGIDVGVMLHNGCVIESMRSHVDDDDGQGVVFSRDCAELAIRTPGGTRFVLLVNHLKSKGYRTAGTSNAKWERQARQIKRIYDGLVAAGETLVAVVGDVNDTPTSAPLAPHLGNTDLHDIFAHPSFNDGGRPGTYANCTKSNKIDYILLSPTLFAAVTAAGVNRTGIWGGANGTAETHVCGPWYA